ncbi:amino acid ABC transporter permease [Demequina sp. TTPB684]|uniref:amino acid ABC transporter permease n=1 Tax=Demequina sp. TTPB684 TaxID=2881057 RepID=UPI001CF1AB39|nr:amino acid ABC transporter permease [Demequina sp. TTPB684]MCB2413703.1 amino acid ABC transporter permease [Demequina sp. TTPB684]
MLISVVAGVLAFVWGVVLAGFRVSPIGPLRTFGAAYVNIVRNSPLTLMFLFLGGATSALVGIVIPVSKNTYFGVTVNNGIIFAIVALTLYTATFVCEVVRSGVNSVSVGQAEAGRSLGLTFGQTLAQVILPQAFRSVIPPLINVFVAHIKNSSVAAGFAATELVAVANRLSNANPSDVFGIFMGIGLAYLVITVPLSIAAEQLEKKVAVAR